MNDLYLIKQIMSNQLNFFLDRLTAFVDLEVERGGNSSVLPFIKAFRTLS